MSIINQISIANAARVLGKTYISINHNIHRNHEYWKPIKIKHGRRYMNFIEMNILDEFIKNEKDDAEMRLDDAQKEKSEGIEYISALKAAKYMRIPYSNIAKKIKNEDAKEWKTKIDIIGDKYFKSIHIDSVIKSIRTELKENQKQMERLEEYKKDNVIYETRREDSFPTGETKP